MATATMTREEENLNQEQEIVHLGTYKWNQLNDLKPAPSGVKLQGLHEDMWSKSGHKVKKVEAAKNRSLTITYDKEYVGEFLYSKVFEPLGIVTNGEFNEDLFEEIFNFAKAYSLDADKREEEAQILRMCRPFIEEKGLPPEKAREYVIKHRELLASLLANLEVEEK